MQPTRTRRESTHDDYRQRVLRVLVHVQSRLDAPLSLTSLAAVARMSPFHFQRVFAELADESSAQLVRRLRLERAARDLRDGELSIAAIAKRAGYAESAPFCRAFRTQIGRAPSTYRDAARSRAKPSIAMPREVRTWIRRPRADGQLSFAPVAASSRDGRAKPGARLVQLPWLRIAFVRREPASRDAANDARELAAFATRRAHPDGELMFLRAHHDDAEITDARRMRVDLAVVVGPRRRGEGEIGIARIEAGSYALATVEGSGAAVLRARRWLERTATALLAAKLRDGPVLEIFLDDARGSDSRRTLVDVLVPVEAPSDLPWYWRRGRPSTA
jgi:AraC family transcriptional regulator